MFTNQGVEKNLHDVSERWMFHIFNHPVWGKYAGAMPTSVWAGKVWLGSTQAKQPQNQTVLFLCATCWQGFPSVALTVVLFKRMVHFFNWFNFITLHLVDK